MQFKDHYRTMGVAPEATAAEIKAAYRRLARKYHPDVSKESGAERRFTELAEANHVLEDPARRAEYDHLRAAGWKPGQEMDAPPPGQRSGSGNRFGETSAAEAHGDNSAQFDDFFQSVFGDRGERSRSGRSGPRRRPFQEGGDDLHFSLPISLEESFQGGSRQFSFQMPVSDGSPGSDPSTGSARSAAQRTITVTIPKGATTGTVLRLRGQGEAGIDGHAGDLYLEIALAAHAHFHLDGLDVSAELPIAPWEAVLGARIAVPTLGGIVTATIPAGSHSGQKLRLKGRGLPGGLPGEAAGDQLLILTIVVPTIITDEMRQLYRDLALKSGFDPRAPTKT